MRGVVKWLYPQIFKKLYMISNCEGVMVEVCLVEREGHVAGDLKFRSLMRSFEVHILDSLMEILWGLIFLLEGEDRKIWKVESLGVF